VTPEKAAELLACARLEKAEFGHIHPSDDDPLPKSELEVTLFVRRRVDLYMRTWVIGPLEKLLAENRELEEVAASRLKALAGHAERPCVRHGCSHTCAYRDNAGVDCARQALHKDPAGLCDQHRASEGPVPVRGRGGASGLACTSLGCYEDFVGGSGGGLVRWCERHRPHAPGDPHASASRSDTVRLAFLAHAFYCEHCVSLTAPKERNEALRIAETGRGGWSGCTVGYQLAEKASTHKRVP